MKSKRYFLWRLMGIQHTMASLLSVMLVGAMCLTPEVWAQNTAQAPASGGQTQPSPAQPANTQNGAAPVQQPQPQSPVTTPQQTGTTVNPSQPPLQPVTTYPDAEDKAQQLPEAPSPQTSGSAQQPAPVPAPQGAATAERVPTVGGAAAKPAGAAIAPAKQHQVRSLLVKLGAVAAGAVAAGTVYALSRSSPSLPPGANSPAAVQKK